MKNTMITVEQINGLKITFSLSKITHILSFEADITDSNGKSTIKEMMEINFENGKHVVVKPFNMDEYTVNKTPDSISCSLEQIREDFFKQKREKEAKDLLNVNIQS